MSKSQANHSFLYAKGIFSTLVAVVLFFSAFFQAAPVYAETGACKAGYSCVFLPGIADDITSDLVLQSIEVTQAVQDAQNSVPLVAGRPAVMRIYATANGYSEAVTNVKVSVEAKKSGNQVSESPYTFTAAVPLTNDRAVYSSTINFPLPESWLTGALDLTVKIDADNAVAEKSNDNNTLTVHLNFNKVPDLKVMIVPVEYTHAADGYTYPAPTKDVISEWLMRIYPINKVSVTWHAPYAFSGDLRTTADFNLLLNEITTLKTTEKAPAEQVYYGLVPTQDGTKNWFFGGVAGIGWVGSRTAVGLDTPGNTAQIAGHEIGHNLGMPHTPCGVSGDPNYPYSGGSIGQYGLDVFTNNVYSPSSSKDIMSYCNPRWISDYTYKFLYDSQVASAPVSAMQVQETTSAARGMLVRATIEGNQANLLPGYILNQETASTRTSGDYTIQVLGMQGEILAQSAVQAYRIQEEEASESSAVYGINAVVPLPDQPAAAMRLVKNDKILAEQKIQVVTTNLPLKVITKQTADGLNVQWGSSNQPALLRYSADGGKTWTTLAADVKNGQTGLKLSALPSSADGIFDVVLANTWR